MVQLKKKTKYGIEEKYQDRICFSDSDNTVTAAGKLKERKICFGSWFSKTITVEHTVIML